MTGSPSEISNLPALSEQNPESAARFTDLAYRQLRRLAGHYMRGERLDHTLQPTALVHEAYLRLFGPGQAPWQTQSHFVRGATRVMRQVLVDHARRRRRAKRGGGQHKISLEESAVAAADQTPEIVLALEDALKELASLDPRQVEIVEMIYFTGLTQEETARALGISERTVRREWTLARARLRGEVRKESKTWPSRPSRRREIHALVSWK
jgi:RNA polymerase sigma factor (TIGR02999 family)